MLPRENRLVHQRDFEEVHRLGNFFSLGAIFLKIKKSNTKETRIGFSIGIKFSAKAVDRNRAKRQLREILVKKLKNIKKGFDVVISIKKKGEKEFSSEELEKDLTSTLKKANLL
jgi:ribonuclease P protein component